MNPADFKTNAGGKIVKTSQGFCAFVPKPLPPPITYDEQTVQLLSDADRALGRLAGIGQLLPNPHLLIAPYMRREAVLSSRIEGTQASLSDLLYFEAGDKDPPKSADVQEVLNYVRAMQFGLSRLEQLPLSLRLLKEIHEILMEGVRGENRNPGEFRESQNWIGPPGCNLNEASFVPPPRTEMLKALDSWEKFLHEDKSVPPLIQCALMHYQFEAIHPFLDGNGRVGRLLITFFLCERGHLPQPLLYLSAFFERYRDEYYRRLLDVSTSGNWIEWIRYFLRGISTQALDAVENSKKILDLQQKYRYLLQQKKASHTVIAILNEIFSNPFVSTNRISKDLKVSFPTAQSGIDWLIQARILREVSGRQRNRIYCAEELLRTIEGNPAEQKQTKTPSSRQVSRS